MFDTSKIKEGALAALAAIVLTSTAMGAALGPANTAPASPVVYAAADLAGGARG